MHRVHGVCPVVETPFTNDGAVDLRSFTHLVERLLEAGVRTFMFPGFASEFYKLTDLERDQLAALLLDQVHAVDGTTVVISVPDHATTVAVARARRAVELGADVVSILPPYLQGPSAAAVREHLTAVLDAIGATPAILQYAPALTGTSLSAAAIAEVAAASPSLAQVKVEAVPPGQLITELEQTGSLSSVVGYAGLQLPDALRRGAVGVQPGCSFVELYLRFWALWTGGDSDAATALHTRMTPYLSYWMQSAELIVAAEKRISMLRGLIATEHCRAPARQLDAEERAMIDRFLAEFEPLLPSW